MNISLHPSDIPMTLSVEEDWRSFSLIIEDSNDASSIPALEIATSEESESQELGDSPSVIVDA